MAGGQQQQQRRSTARSSKCGSATLSGQSCPWVHFVRPDLTHTQPNPLQVETFGPNPIQLTMELTV